MKTKFFFCYGIAIPIIVLGLVSCSKTDVTPSGQAALVPNSVATFAPESVTAKSAVIKGTISNTSSEIITECGIYLTELPDNLITDPSQISALTGKKIPAIREGNNFVVNLTNLKTDTRYGYVGYVNSVSGTAYGKMRVLVTSFGTITDINGNIYQTVRIGEQVWMGENLGTLNYPDNEMINGVYSQETDVQFGKHYTWDAANRSVHSSKTDAVAGVCPTGWHVPSDGEWKQLMTYVGVPDNQLNALNLIGNDQASLLKEGGTDSWNDEHAGNTTGFSILPSGICTKCNDPVSCQAAFWTSTPSIFYGFKSESGKIMRGNHPNCTCGLSIRCVKD